MKHNSKSVRIRRRTASRCKAEIKRDLPGFVKKIRGETAIGSRAVIYNVMQAAAHLTIAIATDSAKKAELLSQEPLCSRRHDDLADAQWAMQSLMNANDEKSRQSANRKGALIRDLLKEGKSPELIAMLLSKGGVSGALRLLAAAGQSIGHDQALDHQPSGEAFKKRDDDDLARKKGGEQVPARVQHGKSSEVAKPQDVKISSSKVSLVVPPASPGHTYVYTEVLKKKLDEKLKFGKHRATYWATPKDGWVLIRLSDDGEDNDDEE